MDDNDGEQPRGNLVLLPEAIFALRYREMSTLGQLWTNLSAKERTTQMFVPCNVDDLHSLIYRALISNSPERGGSLALYRNLNDCLDISPATWTWGKSCLGTRLKIIAIAEVVESQMTKAGRDNEERAELVGTPSEYRLMDASYYKPKYLLVYPQEKKQVSSSIQIRPKKKRGMQNNDVIFAWGIVIILACVLPMATRVPKVPNPPTLLD
ncbi:unnamed protein product [Nesidiocoris tenuis]|uniref:PARP catalytic domain-containing protein n=1 Tax=Nesidiocoris tenuis TaxID=355587 RepID=A0A6H5H7I3_9HEMI|nr:unnamed protein product [Nesidiocoris tenuis]